MLKGIKDASESEPPSQNAAEEVLIMRDKQ